MPEVQSRSYANARRLAAPKPLPGPCPGEETRGPVPDDAAAVPVPEPVARKSCDPVALPDAAACVAAPVPVAAS